MQKVAICILVALIAQVPAARIQSRKKLHLQNTEAVAVKQDEVAQVTEDAASAKADVERKIEQFEEKEALAEDLAEEQREAVANPQDAYWYTHQGSWEFVAPALMNNQYTQQFELKEDYRMLRTKKYEAKLDQFEDAKTGSEQRKDIDSKVLKVENYFWTMHAHQSAKFKDEQGQEIGDYIMFNPQFFNRRYTWRVAKKDAPDNILFTIQKRLYNDHCKYLGFFSCRPVLKIYVGQRGDKSTLIYYGVGDKDLEEPEFKLYHSEAEYKANKKNWVAKVEHKKTKSNGEDKYKVKVKPNEDAALVLLASVCLDKIGDDHKQPEEPVVVIGEDRQKDRFHENLFH